MEDQEFKEKVIEFMATINAQMKNITDPKICNDRGHKLETIEKDFKIRTNLLWLAVCGVAILAFGIKAGPYIMRFMGLIS